MSIASDSSLVDLSEFKRQNRPVYVMKTAELSDDDLALRLVGRHGNSLRYVAAWGHWYMWNGTSWQNDETVNVFDLAKEIYREASVQGNEEKKSVASARTSAAVEKMAKADRRIAAVVDQWDATPKIFNTPRREE